MSCFKIFDFRNNEIIRVLVFLTASFIVCPGFHESSSAQVRLDRISLTERFDGQGFVIRYHLSEAVDSFALAHTEQQRIQMILYSSGMNTDKPLILPDSEIITNLQMIHLDDGLGFDFLLYNERIFRSNAYLDANQRDLLLALTYTEEQLAVPDLPLFTVSEDETIPEEEETPEPVTDEFSDKPAIMPSQRDESADVGDLTDRITPHRVSPGDAMEFYLRWIGEDSHRARSTNHIRYSGYSGSTQYVVSDYEHPWYNHPFFSGRYEEPISPDLTVFNPVLFTSYNSDYPVGGNDGAIWQGRGFNTAFSLGVGYSHDFFEVVLRPVFISIDNRNFELSPTPPYEGLSEFAMPLTYGDIPQRFGTDAVNRLDPGESFLKFIYKGWAAGISNERFRTGPAIYNPLIFGYNAPGFFHTFIGTNEPFEFLHGRFDARMFWGTLRDSGYFYPGENTDGFPDTRFITGLTLNYNPDFLPGLHIGFTRTALSYYPENGLGVQDLLMVFQRSQEKLDNIDPYEARLTKTSFFIRWHFPESGFETYAEWGRYDNRRLLRDILSEPELNRAYVLGFMKRFYAGSGRRVIVNGEITNLENSAVTAQSRDYNIWYTHPVIKHGFTHRGQVLGAPIGPGSSTQRISLSYYDSFGMAGFSLGRIAFHNDRFFRNIDYYREIRTRPWIPIRTFQELEMFGTLHALVFIPGGFELQADARYGVIENRNNQFDVDTTGGVVTRFYFDEPNWNVALTLRYLLSSRNR